MANLVKSIFLLAVFFVVINTEALTAQPLDQLGRDYINCNSSIRDVMLYQNVIERPAKVLQVVSVDEEVSVGNAIIHCIKAAELKPGDAAATVSVTKGGLGYNFVALHVQSQRGHGIHLNVTITGK